MKFLSLAAALFALFVGINTATAAPIAATPSASAPASAGDLLVNVRYGHRNCQRHYVPRWGRRATHRHVRIRRGVVRPRACRRYRTRPARFRQRGCFRIGSVWICP